MTAISMGMTLREQGREETPKNSHNSVMLPNSTDITTELNECDPLVGSASWLTCYHEEPTLEKTAAHC